MLQELSEIHQQEKEKYPSLDLDLFQMADGVYARFNLTDDFDTQIQQLKENSFIYERKSDAELQMHTLYDWFKERDFYNVVLDDDSNKVVDAKRKIWSTTMYSLALREKNILEKQKDKTFQMIPEEKVLGLLESHYDKLSTASRLSEFTKLFLPVIKEKGNRKIQADAMVRANFPSIVQWLESTERHTAYDNARQFYLNHFFLIKQALHKLYGDQMNKDKYIKIYLDDTVDHYQREYELYAYPKIFNKNDTNVLENEQLAGVPMYGVNQNEKKPFLSAKTTRFVNPRIVSLEQALNQREFFPWLKYYQSASDVKTPQKKAAYEPFSKSSYHWLLEGNDIIDFDNVPISSEAFTFTWRNALGIQLPEGQDQTKHEFIQNVYRLKSLFNTFFLSGRLTHHNLKKVPEVMPNLFTNQMQVLFIQIRQALFDFFDKSTTLGLTHQVRRNLFKLLQEQSRQGIVYENKNEDTFKPAKSSPFLIDKQRIHYARGFNLYVSLCDFVEEDKHLSERVTSWREASIDLLQSDNDVVLTDSQNFYYLVGQTNFYIAKNFSQTQDKKFSMLQPLYGMKKPSQFKKHLRQQFKTYSHEISLSHQRLKRAMEIIQQAAISDQTRMSDEEEMALFAGLVADNVFYFKTRSDDNE